MTAPKKTRKNNRITKLAREYQAEHPDIKYQQARAAILRDSAGYEAWRRAIGVHVDSAVSFMDRWFRVRSDRNMHIPLGISDDGEPLWVTSASKIPGGFDPRWAAHWAFLGPAGTTDSLLATFVLSLAVRYGPDRVQFTYIDISRDPERPRMIKGLPHLAYTRSPYDSLADSLRAVEDDLEYRQGLIDHRNDTEDIVAYRELTTAWTSTRIDLPIPLPDTFIIINGISGPVDGATTASLDRVARLGRALGVYLLLVGDRLDPDASYTNNITGTVTLTDTFHGTVRTFNDPDETPLTIFDITEWEELNRALRVNTPLHDYRAIRERHDSYRLGPTWDSLMGPVPSADELAQGWDSDDPREPLRLLLGADRRETHWFTVGIPGDFPEGDGYHAIMKGGGYAASQVLRTMLLSAAMQYGPDRVQFVAGLQNQQAGYGFLPKIPHTASITDGLAQPQVQQHMAELLNTEWARREKLFEATDTMDGFQEYRRSAGADASPLAEMLVILDFHGIDQAPAPELLRAMYRIALYGRIFGMRLITVLPQDPEMLAPLPEDAPSTRFFDPAATPLPRIDCGEQGLRFRTWTTQVSRDERLHRVSLSASTLRDLYGALAKTKELR